MESEPKRFQKSVVSESLMDVDAFEDRDLGFEVKLKELDNADDDFRAAERHST